MEDKIFKVDMKKIGNVILEKEPKLPLHCMLDVYRHIGLYDYWKQYLTEKGMESADPKDYLFCNEKMLLDLNAMIVRNWETFNIDIVADNTVIWKPNDLHTRRKHGKKLHAKVRRSVNWDFVTYCPSCDPELKYGVIVFREPKEGDKKILDKVAESVYNENDK